MISQCSFKFSHCELRGLGKTPFTSAMFDNQNFQTACLHLAVFRYHHSFGRLFKVTFWFLVFLFDRWVRGYNRGRTGRRGVKRDFFKRGRGLDREAQWHLMVCALVPGASGPGSSPGRGHCVVFLGKTLDSHSASLHLVKMSTDKLLGKTNKSMRESDLRWVNISSRGSRNTPNRFMLQKPHKLRQLWARRLQGFT